VESFAGSELDYRLLEGKWLLQFTTAPDVVSIISIGAALFSRLF
jgi:hypothetical protein